MIWNIYNGGYYLQWWYCDGTNDLYSKIELKLYLGKFDLKFYLKLIWYPWFDLHSVNLTYYYNELLT